MEIPIGEAMCKLRIDETRQRDTNRVADVVYRWLKRGMRREKKGTNRPSLRIETERDAMLRRTFLYGIVDTFPDTAPGWLENEVATGCTTISTT